MERGDDCQDCLPNSYFLRLWPGDRLSLIGAYLSKSRHVGNGSRYRLIEMTERSDTSNQQSPINNRQSDPGLSEPGSGMIIDMHVHTEASGDSNATVEEYCRTIQRYRQYHPFGGLVITEHRVFETDAALQRIGEKYGVVVLQGIEIDADFGHLLVYGVTGEFLKWVDITRRRIDSRKVIKIINDCGGIAVPAHPFRESRYGKALAAHNDTLDGLEVIEELNGSSFADQNEQARALVEQNGLKGIGGSDAHYVNRLWFLNCATRFESEIRTDEDLVEELRHGQFRPVSLDSSVLGDF